MAKHRLVSLLVRFSAVAAVAALLLSSVRAALKVGHSLFHSSSEVVDITDLNLRSLHPSAGLCPWILVAYSDGCGHCRSAAPLIIRHAQKTFQASEDAIHEVTVAALNCQVNTQACHDLGVLGVPSFFLFTPDSLEAKAPTLTPLTLNSSAIAASTAEKPAPQRLLRFDIGHGSGVDPHFDFARSTWGSMTTGTWSANNRERCLDMRSFLRHSKQNDLHNTAPDEAKHDGAVFTEDTEFHIVDVANALFYTLYHEVALVGLDSAERRYALYRFLGAVQRRLPGLGADTLLYEMANHRNSNGKPADPADFASFTVADWQKLVLSAGIPFQGTPRDLAWKTCKGSSWRYRGFPCGLWLLYHTLSANAEDGHTAVAATAAADGTVSNKDNTEVLFIIKGYVRNFFSCEVCRRNFMRFEPNREEDPVWQMWKVHNVVNYHLANVTEGVDPLVPKRQFPTKEMCPLCYRYVDVPTTNPESKYVATEVVKFLRRRYRWIPSSLHTPTGTTSIGPHAAADGRADGGAADLAPKMPLSVNIFLSMAVVVVVVVLAMRHVLRRAKAARVKGRRAILPLRMPL
ncbi:quiescin sulfhydryl oxidase putative (QSOX) [Leptomonas pyrrhocoris]|uniref:Sulfhydryl oxidase n=1 Tax=Leptomonas pyrrhocoris TaxID=157538 RepID=A0A0M9G5R4_LEPPY|nr:quiescin sulfhydryl oxidase putative (QSOX) [Leptomonas pyrrhocoris]KPA83020.1 quiescin sulfhydryl oxidase putative (QSOX) [Leptomonas pyrrhocoris]|eukprot:XP_015661459.1 quiescin sulfhydryl oxidase putative (QSOX) [Leptomonas pyrrhocoris]